MLNAISGTFNNVSEMFYRLTDEKNKPALLKASIIICSVYLLFCATAPHIAQATGGEDVFGDFYQRLVEWTQGYIGRFVALLTFVIGGFASLITRSLFYVVIGVGTALIMYGGPGIIDSIMDVAINPNVNIQVLKGQSISNGLY